MRGAGHGEGGGAHIGRCVDRRQRQLVSGGGHVERVGGEQDVHPKLACAALGDDGGDGLVVQHHADVVHGSCSAFTPSVGPSAHACLADPAHGVAQIRVDGAAEVEEHGVVACGACRDRGVLGVEGGVEDQGLGRARYGEGEDPDVVGEFAWRDADFVGSRSL